MVGKLCDGPKGGASSGGLVEYLTGYAVAGKGASKDEIRSALDRIYQESEEREDLGVGRVWSPTAGQGSRPSSILVRNCSSFATSSLEMDADTVGNPGVRHSAMHFVWSFQTEESGRLSDEQVHAYVQGVMKELGLHDHRSVSVVHRDTLVYETDLDGEFVLNDQGNKIVKDGNLHVHVAIGSVHPETGLAYDRTGLHKRMARAERAVELRHHLENDNGLYVVRDRGLSTERVEEASPDELKAWRSARKEERLARQERRSWEGYCERDETFDRYADATVAPRLRAAISLAGERGRAPTWAELYTVASRYGCAIQQLEDGRVVLRDVGIGEMKLLHEGEVKDLREALKSQTKDQDEIDSVVAELKAQHATQEAVERERKMKGGEIGSLDSIRVDTSELGDYLSIDDSELDVIRRVEENPSMVLDDITAQSSTFDRSDVDRWLCSKISDSVEIERLGDLVMQDESIRMLSADTRSPLMTTTEVLQIEDQFAQDARTLAKTKSGIERFQIDRAIGTYEAEQSEKTGKPFNVSQEQKKALYSMERGSLVSIEGLPGVGKTTIMGVVRILGELTGRDVVGITLSQAAAERLESEAGFKCVNSARASIMEENGTRVIESGSIVVIDEAAMMDSRANAYILKVARERGCVVGEVYDLRQLQPIDFGSSARIIKDAALEAGTHSELRDVRRQSRKWHKDAVVTLSDAIIEKDETKRLALVKDALQSLQDHGAITWVKDRDTAIDKAVELKRMHEAMGYEYIMPAADKDTVRHLSEEDRRRAGLEGQGRVYNADGGRKEFAVGDRLMFLENSQGQKGMGILNGDRGMVVATSPKEIAVKMDDERIVKINTRAYRAYTHSNSISHHKSQGASVDASVPVIDRSGSAELVFVAVSRSKHALDLVVPQTSFKDVDELAQHVSDNISLKTTSRHYDEILERTGGKDTLRVYNIEAQREAEPLRRLYNAEIVEPIRQLQAEKMAELRKAYGERKREISDTRSSTDVLLADQKQATADFRAGMRRIFTETTPTISFGIWLADRDAANDKTRELEKQREIAREQQRQREVARIKTKRQTDKQVRGEHSYGR